MLDIPLQLLFQHRFNKKKNENGEYKIQVSTFQEPIADLEKEFGKYGFAHKVDEEVDEYFTGRPAPPPLLGWGGWAAVPVFYLKAYLLFQAKEKNDGKQQRQ